MSSAIIYEDENLLVVHKPAGIATETARIGQADVVSELKNYRSRKKEDTYIGMVHRLDQPVEGLLVFGKNQKVTSQLSSDIQKGALKKSYHALVLYTDNHDIDQENEVILTDYLLKDPKTNLSRVVGEKAKDAKKSQLKYKVEKVFEEGYALVKVEIVTGRHHQIRVQMANAGMPLIGDSKYGNDKTKEIAGKLGIKNVSLLADHLELINPKNKEKMDFTIEYPDKWKVN